MIYSELTGRHFATAYGAGTLSGDGVARGAAGSEAQGTWVQFDLRLSPQANGTVCVTEARFLAFGCPHTIAIADWLVGHAPGRSLREALPEPVRALQQRFAVPVEKLGRLLIVEDAWTAAVGAGCALLRSAQNST
ncbi:MAG: iron-sulfur cluster assembly scaffold protein [Steroidobacterales bacterium]